MINKLCFKCNLEKPLTDYYKHKKTKDGYLGKCKVCTKIDTKERFNVLIQDPIWKEKEQERHREKYYRLEYKEKHKPTSVNKKLIMDKYREKFPEKYLATNKSQKLLKTQGTENHHWSYNKIHWIDVINLKQKEHSKAHRFIIYDQEQMMYRRIDNNELLNTKELHIEWINWCIKNKND